MNEFNKYRFLLKYLFSILLLLWEIVIFLSLIWGEDPHFPYLLFITLLAITAGLSKVKYSNEIFVVMAFLWMAFSAETIGYFIFFEKFNLGRMALGYIPFLIAMGVLLGVDKIFPNTNVIIQKKMLIMIALVLGIGSYGCKSFTLDRNCILFPGNNQASYMIEIVMTPKNYLSLQLKDENFRKEIEANGIKDKYWGNYYCPEMKIRVWTTFGKIVSAKIISFNNTDTGKKYVFKSHIRLPWNKPYVAYGEGNILVPDEPHLWY